MERQSEQELLAIAPVETESLEGNRIYQVTGREADTDNGKYLREKRSKCAEKSEKRPKNVSRVTLIR